MPEPANENFDCELTLDTNEMDYFLETGEMPHDMDRAFETMQELATKRRGPVVCKFVLNYVEPAEKEEEE